MRTMFLFALCQMLGAEAHAQVRKCIDAKTKAVTFSNSACPAGTGFEQTVFTADQLESERRTPQPKVNRSSKPAPRQQQAAASQPPGQRAECHKATIQEPQPFLGTAEEIIVFSDGTVWKDLSYKYLYLYAYSPTVILCPAEGRMTLGSNEFQLMRIR